MLALSVPPQAKRLLDFIAGREAPHGYDTVFGNRQSRMPKAVTRSTVNELIEGGSWRARMFGSSACGRYQFMSYTLAALKKALGLTGAEVMTPAFQDWLGFKLLRDRGYDRFMAGVIGVQTFGRAIAQEWASFPVLADGPGQHRIVRRGQSFYAGDGLNKSLVKPEAVEEVLNSLRPAPAVALATDEPVQMLDDGEKLSVVSEISEAKSTTLPRIQTVEAPPVTKPSLFGGVFGRFFGKKVPAAHERPGLRPHGDPQLWDVQDAMKDRGYYQIGERDGLNGSLTQGAIAQIRKDNGLGDGGVDAEFLERLPTFPRRPVSIERATMPITKAVASRPDLFDPLKLLAGAGTLFTAGGVADGSGLLDTIQSSASKVNDVAGSVQTVFGYASSWVAFAVEHRWIVLVLLGLWLFYKAAMLGLDVVGKIRAAFF